MTTAKKYVSIIALLIVGIAPIALFKHNKPTACARCSHRTLVRTVSLSSSSTQEKKPCAFMAEVHRWYGWRARHPNDPTHFPHAPKDEPASVSAMFSSEPVAMAFDDMDPEPDPSGLGCGCDPFTSSCGFLHSTFGGWF
jgi:hypothetical protein